jgi:tetratricopeptide (TPR) repeat protein
MKPILLLPFCALLALGGGYLGAQLGRPVAAIPDNSAALAPAATPAPDAAGAEQLAALAARFDMLERRLESLQRAPVLVPEVADSAEAKEAGLTPAVPAEGAAAGPEQIQAWFDALLAGDLDYDAQQELWQKIREAKQTDAVIALFEERAAADPNNPDRQSELGQAYLAKIQEVSGGPLAGVWADKADKAFDQALALDERHVEARFMKAISLSFWPPVFGKQGQAVKQFEILLEQQGNTAMGDWQSEAYLMLGNLHMQMGKPEQAKLVFQQGLSLFPQSAQLTEQLGLLD